MSDLVSRRSLLEAYDKAHVGPPGGARKLIEEAPAVDAVPVVHGRWGKLDECANEGVYCSVCHKKVFKICYANQKLKSPYCPNCGARMDGDNDEAD